MNWVHEDYVFNNFIAVLHGTKLYATQDPSGSWFLWNTPAPPEFRHEMIVKYKAWYYSGTTKGGKHLLVCKGTPVPEEVAAASLLIISL